VTIDAHQHFWDPQRGDYGWLTPELGGLYRRFGPADLSPLMASAGVEASILVQAAPSEAETDYLLDLAAQTSWVLGVVGWVDFDRADIVQRIAERAREPLLVGVRPMLQDLSDPDWILAASRSPSLQALADHGLVFDALIRPRHLAAIAEVARRHPSLSIVIDHAAKPVISGKPPAEWTRDMMLAGARPNIACKVSGLLTEAPPGATAALLEPHLDVLIAAFGADRLVFGSDWPVVTQAAAYDTWIGIVRSWLAALGPEAEPGVMGLNARRIYLSRNRP